MYLCQVMCGHTLKCWSNEGEVACVRNTMTSNEMTIEVNLLVKISLKGQDNHSHTITIKRLQLSPSVSSLGSLGLQSCDYDSRSHDQQ